MTCSLPVLLSVLLAAGPSPAATGTWRPIRDDGRVAVFLQAAEAVPTGTIRQATVKRVFAGSDERAYALDTLELDCRAGTYRYLAVVLYDRDGDVVNRYRLADQPAEVPRESYLAPVRRLVCDTPPLSPAPRSP